MKKAKPLLYPRVDNTGSSKLTASFQFWRSAPDLFYQCPVAFYIISTAFRCILPTASLLN
jgi:hypothetical protein